MQHNINRKASYLSTVRVVACLRTLPVNTISNAFQSKKPKVNIKTSIINSFEIKKKIHNNTLN